MKQSFAWLVLAFALTARAAHADDPPSPPSADDAAPVAPADPSAPAAPAPSEPAPPEPAPSAPAPDAAVPAPSEAPSPATPSEAPANPPSAVFPSVPGESTPKETPETWTQTPLPRSAARAPRDVATPAGRAEPPAVWNPTPGLPPSDTGVEEPARRDDSHGLLGPLRLGPVVGVGLPALFSFGGTFKFTRYFGGGVNIGLIPTMKIAYYGDATLSYQEYDVYGRIYPFGGGFFLGTGIGYESATGTLKNHFEASDYADEIPSGVAVPSAIDTESRGSVRALVITPQIGYFHIFAGGFSAGVDFGAQIPIAPGEVEYETRVSVDVPAEIVNLAPSEREVRDTLEKIARTPIPTINFRIGWLL